MRATYKTITLFLIFLLPLVCSKYIDKEKLSSTSLDEGPCTNTEINIPKCNQTDYSEYEECFEAVKSIQRKKRAACEESLLKTCQKINADCLAKCTGNATCQDECPVCPLNADLLSKDVLKESALIQQLKRAPEEADVDNTGYHTIVLHQINGNNHTVHRITRRIENGQNATTVLKLTNILNTTNYLDIPLNITTNNAHQISVYLNESLLRKNETKFSSDQVKDQANEPCCWVIRPKSCFLSSSGVRCQHDRHKTCGPQCTAKIIHAQVRKRCKSNGKCVQRIAYVPQPERPTCIYIEQWPYVACGVRSGGQQGSQSCQGCYDHYGNGFNNFYQQGRSIPHHCRYCYDNSFDIGPLYRRGPFLRPFHYHQPPCYVTGLCYTFQPWTCGFGCFGHEQIDPVWGYEVDNEDDDLDYDSDEFSVNEVKENENSTFTGDGNDWGVPLHKCKVVSNDGSITISNCTNSNIEDNLYATKPVDTDFSAELKNTHKSRNRRHHESKLAEENKFNDDENKSKSEETFNKIQHHSNYKALRPHKRTNKKHNKRRFDIIFEDEERK